MAQQKATQQGITADGVVRHGSVEEELIGFCHEIEADYLVLGKPKVEHEDRVFTHDLLRAFVARTEEQTGAKVIFPEVEAL
jgi:hypothetical protein